MRRAGIILGAVLVLAAANYTIYDKEQLLAHGRVVLLQLAPVDPRSLMQGDYMALRFQAVIDAFPFDSRRTLPADGRVVLALDERGVGKFMRIDNGQALAANEIAIRYRLRDGQPKVATNAFFFQEGHADRYARARYGEFRVAADGDTILTGLRDDKYELLGAAR